MPVSLKDPELGILNFREIEGSCAYEFRMSHPISRIKVSVSFYTDSRDRLPTFSQKQFLQRIIDNFHEVVNSISNAFPDQESAMHDKLSFADGQFDLSTIGIPLDTGNDLKWDISFCHHKEKARAILANFENMSPVKVWLENVPPLPLFIRVLLRIFGK